MKNLLINMLGIETYAEEYEVARERISSLSQELEAFRSAYSFLNKKYQELQKIAADQIKYVDMETRKLEEQFSKCADTCEEIVAEANKKSEECDRAVHRAFAEGRMSAYSEMGIWNIEAHERGNCLVILEDGKIVELFTANDLEDVKPDDDNMTTPDLDGIIIDDLTETGA